MTYDLGLLAVFDTSPLDIATYNLNREEYLQSSAREGLQGLINQLWQRPTTVSDEGVMASLPEITTVLPREKPLPKVKELTKWEKFAKSKGIAGKPKKDRMTFDEDKQDYVARWGYKGKNKEDEKSWLVEVNPNLEDDANPRADKKQERKARTLKNAKQQEANISRAKKITGKKSRRN